MSAAIITSLILAQAAPLAGPSAHLQKQDKPLRLAQDRAELQQSLERLRATDTSAELLDAIDTLLQEDASPGWLRLDGWALRRKDLESYVDWFRADAEREGRSRALDVEAEDHPIGFIRYYAQALEEEGVDLLVVPLPMRVQVYPDRIPGVHVEEPFHGAGAQYTELLLALSRAGIEVVDLLPVLADARESDAEDTDRRVFLDYDHHWTPRGVALAAQRIADRVRCFPWFVQGPDREGEDFRIEIRRGSPQPASETKDEARRRPWQPREARDEQVWFRSVCPLGDSEEGATDDAERDGSNLTHGSILLIGDSFVGTHTQHDSDLASHLYARLGYHVDSIYNPGGGMRVWKTVARRGDRLLAQKLIIWVFSARALAAPPPPRVPLFDER